MELYLFLALLLIYILTAFMVKKVILHKIWTLAFILAFVVTAVSIAFIRVIGQYFKFVGVAGETNIGQFAEKLFKLLLIQPARCAA